MGISLSKGQTINLSKDSGSSLTKVFMGLGWDPVVQKKGGFLGGIFGGGSRGGEDIDLDASVIVLDSGKKVLDTVSFSQLSSKDGSIRHGGDNLTGQGEGDDEVIYVDLTSLPYQATHLVFTVNSFRGQTFDEVENAFARLVDDTNQKELCRYTLTEQGRHTGVVMASMSKGSDGWRMTAHGKPCQGRTVKDIAKDAVAIL
jgi:tellurium resistance protein TerZ